MENFDDFCTLYDGGIRLTVKAKPGAIRERPLRLVGIGDGRRALEIAVAEAPEDGKANKAIAQRLARLLGVRKTEITLKAGQTGRLKIVEVAGDSALLRERLGNALGPAAGKQQR